MIFQAGPAGLETASEEEKMRPGKLSVLAVLALLHLLVPDQAAADTYIKQKVVTESYEVMGQVIPSQESFVSTWMAEDRARMDQGSERSVIIRIDEQKVYILDHVNRNYLELPLGGVRDMVSTAITEAGEDLSEEEKAQAAGIADGLAQAMTQVEAAVTDTGEEKDIQGWKSRKYILEINMPMGSSTSEVWASEDVDIDEDLYKLVSNAMLSREPAFEKVLEEMEKIKGFAVYQEVTSEAMGASVKHTQELVEYGEKDPPEGHYEITAGYLKGGGP
jgi:hypothetical protein